MPTLERRESRALILAHRGRDAEVIAGVVGSEGVDGELVENADQLVAEIKRGAALGIVCEESLSPMAFERIAQWMDNQEAWSDFPFLVLLGKRASPLPAGLKSRFAPLGNVVLLERPLSAETLASAALSAVRARRRQYEARELLIQRETVAGELAALNAHLEDRVNERTLALGQANDRLATEVMERERAQQAVVQAQKLEALGRLTGGVAHDFNNVLNVVMGNVELIGLLSKEESIKERARTAKAACKRGAKLTSQLLTFARNQSLDLRALPVQHLFNDVDALIKPILGENVGFISHVGQGVEGILADASQMEMALLNLAINAKDAMEGRPGHLALHASIADPPREKLPEGDYVCIAMSDNGSGMSPEVVAKVFEPFFTTKGMGKGTGLGLSQVYGMAHQSGGAVAVRSKQGSGTVIEMWIPAVQGEALKKPAREPESATLTGLKVLLVEDDAAVRGGMVDALLTFGCDVSQAASGADGLAALALGEPDLLLTDYLMPGMTGVELAIKAKEMLPNLPVLIATGYADMDAIEASIGAGAVLRKPFQLAELSAAVARAAAKRNQPIKAETTLPC
jgi:signal transduction histidine kinase/ActR/RegA family two-component response regulator